MMNHYKIINSTAIIILYIIVIATAWAGYSTKTEGERFTLQDGLDLHKHFHGDEETPDFLLR